MCFSYAVNFNKEALQSRLQLEDLLQPEVNETISHSGYFVSGFTFPKLPVIFQKEEHLAISGMNWGLIPRWCKSGKQTELQKLGLNAKCETVHEKPMFKHAFAHGRCVVPASGFFEWREVNKKKYPYFIHPAASEVLYMAGISETWVDLETGEEKQTYGIVTSPANALLAFVHNTKLRMPLVLNERDIQTWIFGTEEAAKSLMKPCEDDVLAAHTVSRIVSSPVSDRNVVESQVRVVYPELESNSLF